MKSCKAAMNKKVGLLLVLAPMVLLPGCAPWSWLQDKLGMNKNEKAITIDKDDAMLDEGEVLVSMNGKSIISTKSLDNDFEQLLEENPQLKSVLPLMPDAKYNFLQGMVSQAVVDAYVKDKGIDQKSEYQKDLNRMMKSVERMLNTKYFGMEYNIDVTDAEVEKFYEDNKDTMPDLMLSRGGVNAVGISFNKEDAAKSFANKAKGREFAKVAKDAGLSNKVRDFKLVNSQSLGLDNAVKNRVIAMTKFPAVEVVKGEDKAFWVVFASGSQDTSYRPLDQVKVGLKQYMEKEKRMALFDKEIGKLKEQYQVVVNDSYFNAQKQMGPQVAGHQPDQSVDNHEAHAAPKAA